MKSLHTLLRNERVLNDFTEGEKRPTATSQTAYAALLSAIQCGDLEKEPKGPKANPAINWIRRDQVIENMGKGLS